MVGVTLCTLTGTSAFATETDTNSTNSGKILEIEKTFETDEGTTLPNETFQFSMKPDTKAGGTSTDGNYLKIYKGVSLGDKDTISISYDANSATTQKASFDLSSLTFTNTPGIYKYIVKEVIPSRAKANANITYDKNEYSVSVYVNKKGEIVAIVSYNSDGSKTPIKFTNTYKEPEATLDQLIIKKSVGGSIGDKTARFDFNLNLELAAAAEAQGTITRNDNSSETVTFKSGDNSFKLADGDVLTVSNLPIGTLYTVTESGASDYATDIVCNTKDSSGKDKKVDVDNSKNYSASSNQTPIVAGGTTIVYTNTKDYVAPTGVRLDIMPYLAMFAIASVGAILLFAARLRKIKR
jgi:pilin isopeptide linkage protein